MWRLMIVAFAFMGWSFYELSGGADYAPRADSLQVAMQTKPFFAQPAPLRPRASQLASDSTKVDLVPGLVAQKRAAVKAVKAARKARREARYKKVLEAQDAARNTSFTLSAAFSNASFEEMGISGVGAFSADTLLRDTDLIAQDGDEQAEGADTQFGILTQAADIREVTGDLVNMRDGPGTDFPQIDKLTQGTQVEVLEASQDGWLRLRVVETGETGWMADWLVTAAAY